MPKITEKDIVAFLEEKLTIHAGEVKRINDILTAMNEKVHLPEDDPSASSGADKKDHSNQTHSRIKALVIPENYRAQLSFSRKIAYVLNKIHTGIKEEIAAEIIFLEPELNIDRVIRQLSTVLSELKAKKLLLAVKDGRKFRYKLPESAVPTT